MGMLGADSSDVLHETDQTARRFVGTGSLNSPISTESTFIVKDIRGITARYAFEQGAGQMRKSVRPFHVHNLFCAFRFRPDLDSSLSDWWPASRSDRRT